MAHHNSDHPALFPVWSIEGSYLTVRARQNCLVDRSAPKRPPDHLCARSDAPRLCSLTLIEELATQGANRAVLAHFGASDGTSAVAS